MLRGHNTVSALPTKCKATRVAALLLLTYLQIVCELPPACFCAIAVGAYRGQLRPQSVDLAARRFNRRAQPRALAPRRPSPTTWK